MAAQTICRNIAVIFFAVPLGLAQASGVLVGNSIGAKKIHLVNQYIIIGTGFSFLIAFLSVAIMYFF